MVKLAGIDEFGGLNSKTQSNILEDLKIAMRFYHGPDLGLEPGDIDLQLAESVAPELRTLWAGLEGSFLQAFISSATGTGLDKAVRLILPNGRNLSKKSDGQASFSRTTAAPAGGISIPVNTVISTAAGVEFQTDAAATIVEGQTSVTVDITARSPGANGNVSSGTITVIVSTLSGVDSVTNSASTTGGANQETDDALRARALNSPGVRGKGTIEAIRAQLRDLDGVTSADLLVNSTETVSADVTLFESDETGTASENVDTASSEKIAQKFTVGAAGAWVQDIKFITNDGGVAPILTARIETDSSGDPSGSLADPDAERTGVDPNDGTETTVHFTAPSFLEQGTYHVVLVPTSGDFTLDGGTGGTADQVKFFNGSAWVNSANIENGNVEVVEGLPPHSVEPFVIGGTDQAIADLLFTIVVAGIATHGNVVNTVTDEDSGNTFTIRFTRPTETTIHVSIEVITDDDWDATNGPDAVRDAIIAYIGGTDTEGVIQTGLGLGADVIRNRIRDAVMDVAGVTDIDDSKLKIDTANPPVATTGNIAIGSTTIARAETAANIDVTTA